jgi:hypothetical protein
MKSPKNGAQGVLLQESQQRAVELEKALQDVYTWAYLDGRRANLDRVMDSVSVPPPAKIVTRNRMARVWEEGCERFPEARIPGPGDPRTGAVAGMLRYASYLPDARRNSPGQVREWLWEISAVAAQLLSEDFDVLGEALEEYSRAAEKHPGMTLECNGHTDATRLFALVEEIGEVAACLTYDNATETGHGSDLESEVIQVIALALAWATRYLEDGEA